MWTFAPASGRPFASTTTPASSPAFTSSGPFTSGSVGTRTADTPSFVTRAAASNVFPSSVVTRSGTLRPGSSGPFGEYGRLNVPSKLADTGSVAKLPHTLVCWSADTLACASGRPAASVTVPFSPSTTRTASNGSAMATPFPPAGTVTGRWSHWLLGWAKPAGMPTTYTFASPGGRRSLNRPASSVFACRVRPNGSNVPLPVTDAPGSGCVVPFTRTTPVTSTPSITSSATTAGSPAFGVTLAPVPTPAAPSGRPRATPNGPARRPRNSNCPSASGTALRLTPWLLPLPVSRTATSFTATPGTRDVTRPRITASGSSVSSTAFAPGPATWSRRGPPADVSASAYPGARARKISSAPAGTVAKRKAPVASVVAR